MKICITSSGDSLNSEISPRFGRCPYFLIVDTETRKVEVVENKSVSAIRGAGVAAVQRISDLDCGVVITGNVGPNAFYALQQAGIKIFTIDSDKTCKEALRDYNDGKLSEVSNPSRSFYGHGLGRGGCGGRGRGGK